VRKKKRTMKGIADDEISEREFAVRKKGIADDEISER